MRQLLLICISLLALASPAAAQTMLDIVPKDGAASIAIRNLDELIERGDAFLTGSAIKVPLRPSQLFDMGIAFVGVQRGYDRKRPAAIALLPPEKKDDANSFRWLETGLVPILPFTDADTMAGNFNIAKGDFKPKAILKTGRANNEFLNKYIVRSQDHIALSSNEQTLKRLQQSKSVAGDLEPAQRKLFDDGDVIIHVGKYVWSLPDAEISKELASRMVPGDDPKEKEFAENFAGAIKDIDNMLFGFHLKDGIDGHFLATVPKAGPGAKFLANLRTQKKSSTLHGLPEGNLLFAQASASDSANEKLLAKALFSFLFEDLFVKEKIIPNVDRLQYLGLFQEVWRQLEGHRIAVFQNDNEAKEGLFSTIGILDTNDPQAFLKEMKTLARMAVADTLDFSRKEVQEEIDIAKIVKSLGSTAFQVRQSANTKLRLIGEPALPYLQKAIDSKELDLETLRRAQSLHQQINEVAALRRKELLRENAVPLFLRPRLTFVANAEKRQGQSIDGIQIKLPAVKAGGEEQAMLYSKLLGPDWDKMRLAVVGKQIVVMLGSNVELFDATLRNVQKNDAGLAGSKQLAPFYARAAKERVFELHVSIESVMRLTTSKAEFNSKAQISSVGLSLGASSLQLDARMPMSEIRLVAKKVQDDLNNP